MRNAQPYTKIPGENDLLLSSANYYLIQTILNSWLGKSLLLNVSALAPLPGYLFYNITCCCATQHPNLHDLFVEAGSSTLSFDLKKTPPQTCL